MRFAALPVIVCRSPKWIVADDATFATWCRLQVYCAEQENDGRIAGARSWDDVCWSSAAPRVTAEKVARAVAAGLCEWASDTLVVLGFDASGQRFVQSKRDNGKLGGRPRNTVTPRQSGTCEPIGYSDPKPEVSKTENPYPIRSDPILSDPKRSPQTPLAGGSAPASPGSTGTLPGCADPSSPPIASPRVRAKATRAPRQPSPTAELQRQVIAWWCEEWRAKRKAAYAVNRRDPQFVRQWLEGLPSPPDEQWFRATVKRYLAAQLDQFELTQSGHHSLWWLLDRGMTRFGAAQQQVGYDVAIKRADAEHAARRREEQRAAEEPSPIVCDVAAEIEKAFPGWRDTRDEDAARKREERAKVRSQ